MKSSQRDVGLYCLDADLWGNRVRTQRCRALRVELLGPDLRIWVNRIRTPGNEVIKSGH